jgi:hypothetical protein
MIEFLKNIYGSFYEATFQLGIEKYRDLFSILFIILFISMIVFLIKTSIQYAKLINETKRTKRKIDKIFIDILKDNIK